MDTLINVFVGLHIIGIAALLGGFLTQLRAMAGPGAVAPRFVPGMLYGAGTMLVTGLLMVGLLDADGRHPDMAKIGVKLAVLIVILGLVYVQREEEKVDTRVFAAVGGLTVVNIFIALLWT
ncbi:hypothetical protein [Actinacidiphila yeochonensis]|uniref:hypothetical protein n=1 Tax=Actinacidiphila yeochonensis TaxID=89050 RepID=UPI000564A7C6|nr:hypothetical protein [Actinacidiphila yeochonensis]